MPYAGLALPDAVYTEQGGAEHFTALLLDQGGPDNDVDRTGLVFDGDEEHTLGGAGALPDGDDAAAARELAVLKGV